jgi:tripartite-type tricarboxylate transporter receptor subunit TctC
MFRIDRCAAAVLAALFLSSAPQLARAQEWPQRTVKFIVPLGAGAGADIGGRLIAERVQKKWNRAVIIENKPGGDSIPAIQAFVSANDDHVLFFSPSGNFVVHPHRYAKLPYDPARDLQPIARVSNTIIAVAASNSINATSVKDVIERMRAEPGKMDIAMVPGTAEMTVDSFLVLQGLKATKVPYRNILDGVNDLATGRLQFMMASYAMFQPVLQNNSVKLLALTNSARSELVPGVPTVAELGFPGLELDGLVGLFGPRDMSLELRRRIGADVVEAAKDPELQRRLAASAQTPNPGGADEFAESMRKQAATIAAIAKTIGMEPK